MSKASEQKPVEIPEVLSAERAALLKKALEKVDVSFVTENLATLQEIYKYHGFDVAYIQRVFITHYMNINEEIVIEVAEGANKAITGQENIGGCLSVLAFLYNFRGNNLDAILKSLREPNKAKIAKLFNRLRLRAKVSETVDNNPTKNRATLTLSRLAAAFPLNFLNIAIDDNYERRVIDMSDLGIHQDNPAGRAICHPLAPSTLTRRQIENQAHLVTFVAAVRLNSIIGPKAKKVDYARIWMFHKAILNSLALKEKEKIDFWKMLGNPDFKTSEDLEEYIRREYKPSAQMMEELMNFGEQ